MSIAIDICNRSLNLLGERSISSLDENTQNARRCSLEYDQARLTVLRMHPWSFATKRVRLAPLTITPEFGYTSQYSLPRDYVRLISTNTEDYTIESRYVLTNEGSSLDLVYVYDNSTSDDWDSLFVDTLTYYLAYKLSRSTVGASSQSQEMLTMYMKLLQSAKTTNGIERPNQQFITTDMYTFTQR
jgi:hypothetical protein